MKIRKASSDDMKDIAEIEWESGYKWNESEKEVIDRTKKELFDRECYIGILEDKEAIGYFAISHIDSEIGYFAIKKKYQGNGFSKIMMKEIIKILKEYNCKYIELQVWGKNFPAIGLYNKFDFYVTNIIKNKYSNGDSKLKMRKDL